MKTTNKFASLLLLSGLVFGFNSNATIRKVLFIGNSYTYTNNMPLMLQNMTTAMGDTLIYDQSTIGGYTFSMHDTNATTIAKIFSQQWDIVVLQEQSELPSFPPAEVDTEVYPYAHKLDSLIHANDSCTQTMFFMTWGHANGDPLNCSFYPVICTYSGMEQRLRASYMQMTQDNHAIVAPVGAAWNVMMDSFASSIWLYIPDSSHPAVTGSYLASCVFYSSIFHKPVSGCAYNAGLPLTQVSTIQRISDKVVMDSLSQWQQYGHYPFAGFNAACYGDSAVITGVPVITQNYKWSFGDGITLSDTSSFTSHIYPANATYTVTLTVSDSCFTETQSKSVTCSNTKNSNLNLAYNKVTASQDGNGNVNFQFLGVVENSVLEVFDIRGVLIRKYEPNTPTLIDKLPQGFYFLRYFSMNSGTFSTTKIFIK